MGRLESKLFRLNDEIAALEREERLIKEELAFHRHLNDDAQRDAAVSSAPLDRADARETEADVARFESEMQALRRRRERLQSKRERLLRRIG